MLKFLPSIVTTFVSVFITLLGFAFAENFTLSSSTIGEGKQLKNDNVYEGFGCRGGNLSPDLVWTNAPQGTESFAVTLYDPDAPTGSGWWHWFMFNIPANANKLPVAGVAPEGAVELVNDYGKRGFGGACPPPGEVHRHQFKVYALKTKLDIDGSVSNALAGYMVRANSLAEATITAVYSR